MARAPALQAGGQGFDSLILHPKNKALTKTVGAFLFIVFTIKFRKYSIFLEDSSIYCIFAIYKKMIKSIKHKGLSLLWVKADGKKLPPNMVDKIRRLLVIIDTLEVVPDDLMNLPFRPHPLKGNLSDYWAMNVTGNWRIIFRFNNDKREATDLDLIDYH